MPKLMKIYPVPEKAKFLNERQKHIALTRIQEGRGTDSREHATLKQVMGMVMDWKLIVL